MSQLKLERCRTHTSKNLCTWNRGLFFKRCISGTYFTVGETSSVHGIQWCVHFRQSRLVNLLWIQLSTSIWLMNVRKFVEINLPENLVFSLYGISIHFFLELAGSKLHFRDRGLTFTFQIFPQISEAFPKLWVILIFLEIRKVLVFQNYTSV